METSREAVNNRSVVKRSSNVRELGMRLGSGHVHHTSIVDALSVHGWPAFLSVVLVLVLGFSPRDVASISLGPSETTCL
jgi:hypothetical protein